MADNLFQIVNMDDLLYFLRGGKDKLITLSLVLLTTDESIKRMIKKFVKRKSEQYPGVTFLYYAVRKQDFNRISFLTDDLSEYPKMCHIFNITELLMEVRSIDNIDILNRSFQHPDIVAYYSKFGLVSKKPVSNVFEENENGYNENENGDEESDDFEDEQISTAVSGPTKVVNTSQSQQNPSQQFQLPQNPMLEKKKLLEKLTLIRQKGEEYNMQFLEECRNRKKEEEKTKEKEKDKEKEKTNTKSKNKSKE
jgi:hypothetical protein